MQESALRRMLRNLTRSAGITIRKYTPLTSFELQRHVLSKLHHVSVCIDGGANVGQWGEAVRDAGFAGRIISIEPGSAAFAHLTAAAAADSLWSCHRLAVGSKKTVQTLNVTANSVSSSLMNPLESTFNEKAGALTIGTEEVHVVRLDEFIQENYPSSDIIYLKLDVQGYETAAIEGANGILHRAPLIELEVSLVSLYDNSENWFLQVERMRYLGYEVVAVQPNTIDSDGRTLEINVIFERQSTS